MTGLTAQELGVTPEEVKTVRERAGCSLMEARRALVGAALIERTKAATTLDELRPIMLTILEVQYGSLIGYLLESKKSA